MKNFINLLIHFKFKELFVDDTDDGFIQFFRFCFVGGVATIADMGTGVVVRNLLPDTIAWDFGLFTLTLDAIAGASGFIIGLVVNYLISIAWVFKRKDINRVKEFTVFAIIGIIGLCINTGVMEALGLWLTANNNWMFLFKKLIATFVTLIWNFTGRKLILYRKKAEEN